MVSYEGVEGVFGVGIVAVIVYVEDREGAVLALKLDSCKIVSVRDIYNLPTAGVQGGADPYQGSYWRVVSSSVLWKNGAIVSWCTQNIEFTNHVRFLNEDNVPVFSLDVVGELDMGLLRFVEIQLENSEAEGRGGWGGWLVAALVGVVAWHL